MNKAADIYFLWLALVLPSCAAPAVNAAEGTRELLKRVRDGNEANNLVQLKKCEIVTTNTWTARYENAPFQTERFEDVTTYRRDGARVLSIWQRYELSNESSRKLVEHSYTWNEGGKKWHLVLVLYDRPRSLRIYPGTKDFENSLEVELNRKAGSAVLPRDHEAFYDILQKGSETKITNRSVSFNGCSCICFEGRTTYGQYTVYVDPACDYLMRTGACVKVSGDLQGVGEKVGMKLPPVNQVIRHMGLSRRIAVSIDGVEIDKVGQLTYAKKSKSLVTEEFEHGTYICSAMMRRAINLNPDFSASDTFKPVIPDGTPVAIDGPGKEAGQFIWQSGKLLPYVWKDGKRVLIQEQNTKTE